MLVLLHIPTAFVILSDSGGRYPTKLHNELRVPYLSQKSVQSTAIYVIQSAGWPNLIFCLSIPGSSIGFVEITFPDLLNNCSSSQYLLFLEFLADDL